MAVACITTVSGIAQEFCSFTKVSISDNDKRLLELSRIIEYRSESFIPESIREAHNAFDTCLVAERYKDGKCVSREMFSAGKLAQARDGGNKGVISFGWNIEKQSLSGVNGSGNFRFPGHIKLQNFNPSSPRYSSFFKISKPEVRIILNYKSTIYPVFGIIGLEGEPKRLSKSLDNLSSEQLSTHYKSQKDAVIVYLCFRSGIGHENVKDQTVDVE